MSRIPLRLENDPIVEAVFEIRFVSNVDQAGDLLPGLLYPSVSRNFPKIESLPAGQIPREIIDKDPTLHYQPLRRLVGEQCLIQTGDRVLSLACRRPYMGWEVFRSKIREVLASAKATNVLRSIERFSLKYINVLPTVSGRSALERLRLQVSVGSHDAGRNEAGFSLRCELRLGDFINVIQIVPNATAKLGSETVSGVLVDIDTIFAGPIQDFWKQIDELLEKAHDTEKSVFFEMLTPETMEEMNPIWKR